MTDTHQHPNPEDMQQWQRSLAPQAFNRAWELLDADGLTREEEEEMLAAAFTQRYHWYAVGDARTWAIADWQVSRVATVLGYADLASRFGERSLEIATEHGLDAFVIGFAHEAIARAAAEVDDIETFTEHLELAKAMLAEIDDPEDRETLESDLAEMSEP
jgi:hypothetical protein